MVMVTLASLLWLSATL